MKIVQDACQPTDIIEGSSVLPILKWQSAYADYLWSSGSCWHTDFQVLNTNHMFGLLQAPPPTIEDANTKLTTRGDTWVSGIWTYFCCPYWGTAFALNNFRITTMLSLSSDLTSRLLISKKWLRPASLSHLDDRCVWLVWDPAGDGCFPLWANT